MTQEFQEHWLSAYLDDELSAQERALVEQRLQEDPATRELLNDLKRVRGMVATLPPWPGDFQLDMSGLRIESLEEANDDLSDSSGPIALAPPAFSQPTKRALPRSQSGDGYGTWRTILAIAASGILVLLGGAYVWQQYGPAQNFSLGKVGEAAPGSRGGSSQLGQGETFSTPAMPMAAEINSSAAETMSADAMPPNELQRGTAESNFDAPSSPAALTDQLRRAPGAFSLERAEEDATQSNNLRMVPPKAAMEDSLAENAPQAMLKSEDERLQGFAPPSPLGKAIVPSDPAAIEARSLPAEPNLPPASSRVNERQAASEVEFSFVCAHSNAWTDQEVRSTLPVVEGFLPQSAQLPSVPELGRETTSRFGGSSSDKQSTAGGAVAQLKQDQPTPLAAPIITSVLDQDNLDKWLTDFQSVQPLTKLKMTSLSTSGDVASSAQANVQMKDSSASAQSPGTMMLFVTQAEAEKILATVQKPKAAEMLRFWRVLPEDASKQTSSPDDKVILILSQPPR